MSLLKMVWMFLWEVFMGEQDFKETYKKDKTKILMFSIMVFSLFMNYFTIKRIISISNELVMFRHEMAEKGCYNTQVKKMNQAVDHALEQTAKTSVIGGAENKVTSIPESKPVPASVPKSKEYHRHDELMKTFDEMEK